MKFSLLSLVVAAACACSASAHPAGSTAHTRDDTTSDAERWTNDSPEPIEHAPAPWTLEGTVFGLTFVPIALPKKSFGPLERGSPVQTEGHFVGGIGMIQLIRYHDSPVGPYDELLIIPGFYSYEGPDGTTKKNVRISRIYVSQKYTAWNGRTNWNIPKHLAKFDWDEKDNGDTTVKIYPHDIEGDESESKPSSKPWFQATFRSDPNGGVPFSTDLYALLGVNTTLAQPPLPGKDSFYGELPATHRWAATVPGQETNQASLQLVDMVQPDCSLFGDNTLIAELLGSSKSTHNAVGDECYRYFWPGLLPIHPAMRLDNAKITFSDPVVWGEEEN